MRQATTPAQYAEAPPNDPMHPAVVDRLAGDMRSLTVHLDASDARSMAADGPWKAMTGLAESLRVLIDEVELHRPTVH